MANDFHDFDLGIWKEGDVYKAEVRASPAGTCDRTPFDWPFKEDHRNLLRDLELSVMRAHGYRGALLSPDEAKLRDFGTAVFDAVFRGAPQVHELYNASLSMAERDGCPLRLKLRVDPPELAVLPWEYVYDKVRCQDFICLDENQPLVRFFDRRASPPLPVDRALRVLAMVANPKGDLDTEKERRRIDKAFENVPGGEHELRWVQGQTADALFEALRDGPWDIFHFIGHGGADAVEDAAGQVHTVGYLLLQGGDGEEQKLYPSRLTAMLKMSKVRLAVLNCCDSGRGAVTGLGATLVRSSVPLAVAMQFPISDQAALEFSGEFYRALVRGASVEKALAIARTVIYARSGLEWGIPVLFTRVDPTVMFKAAPPAGTPPVSAAQLLAAIPPAPVPIALAPPVAPPLTEAQRELRRLWGA